MPPAPALRQPPRLPAPEGGTRVPSGPRLVLPAPGTVRVAQPRLAVARRAEPSPASAKTGPVHDTSVTGGPRAPALAEHRNQTEMIAALMARQAGVATPAEQPPAELPPAEPVAPELPSRTTSVRRPGTAPRWASLISVLLHAAVLVLLLFWTHRDLPSGGVEEGIPIVFENGGSPNQNAGETDAPAAEAAPASGPTPLSPPTPEAPPAAPEPQPATPPPPATPPVPPPPPEVAPPPPVPPPPAPPPTPAPVPVQPAPPPIPEAALQPPPPVLEAPTPFELPLRPEPPSETQQAEAPPPRPAPTPREAPARPQRQANNPFSGMLSLNQAPAIAPGGGNPAPVSPRRPGQGLDMSLSTGLTQRNSPSRAGRGGGRDYAAAGQQIRVRSGANPGGDWISALKQWVEERKFYPEAAILRGEDGPATLQLVISRDGTVQSLRLVSSSGSRSLDAAWQSMFRDRKVPAFLPGTPGDSTTIDVTMNYILVNR